MRFVDVRSDIAFKRIFGNENKKEILISFLNAVLGLSGDKEIDEITILDPYQAPKVNELKYTVIDIRAVDKRGVTFIVEIQIQRERGFEKRVLYYTGKAYINQLTRGEDYPKLNQVIYIGIVDFAIFDGNNYLTRHLILNTETYKQELKDFEFNFIELPKFKKGEDEVETIIEKWVHFIKNAHSLQMVPKCADFAEIQEAYEIANESTWSKEEYEIYEDWQIKMQIEKGIIEYRVENALIEGERRGLIKGMEKILAIKYSSKGLELIENVRSLESIETIEDFTAILMKSTSVDELWAYFRGT
ncbi:hypothetical protein MBAV_004531 [Candidatus Magnetobacterium bavaricum]|uniref:Transposase n=1 Tax=Candidatus Magnetobacterium bavaricum TaxID=29290 RepID=A0A0F3GMX8_9BACT|nr:hypothetical protein MBAV_004531 [Candidatus Magnetobacterium bavaricum]